MALDVTQGLSGWSSDPPQAADCISYSSGSLSSEPGPADPDEHPVFRSGEPRPPPKCRRNLRRRGLAGTRRRAVVLADLTGPRRSHAGSPIARRGAGAGVVARSQSSKHCMAPLAGISFISKGVRGWTAVQGVVPMTASNLL